MIELCGFPKDLKWDLKYRGTRNGFKASDFNAKCDGIANSLTVIKSESGNIFGGFAKKEWHLRGGVLTDPSSFIFSLVNKDENPFKANCSNGGQYAICCSADLGPVFGGDDKYLQDVVIKSDSNTLKKSYSNIGFAYQHPDYQIF